MCFTSCYLIGVGDELTRAEARCVHCGAPGSIRDFLKEGQYCSPQCAEVNARKYAQLPAICLIFKAEPKMLNHFATIFMLIIVKVMYFSLKLVKELNMAIV